MDRYLVSYEYKEKRGSFVYTKTTTEVLTSYDLECLTKDKGLYGGYLKVLFLKKL